MVDLKKQVYYDGFDYFVELEFYTKLSEKQIKDSLKHNLGISLDVQTKLEEFNEEGWVFVETPKITDSKELLNTWKLERNFKKDVNIYKLTSSLYSYELIRNKIIKLLNWVKEKCWSKDDCVFSINILPNKNKYQFNTQIMNITNINVCLNFIEDEIYSKFPKLKKSKFSKPIKNKIYPKKEFISQDAVSIINIDNFDFPNDSTFIVNFDKLKHNIFCVNLGGEDYSKDTKKILNLFDDILNNLLDMIQNGLMFQGNQEKLNKILSSNKKTIETFSNFNKFKSNYKRIKLKIDLIENDEMIKTYYQLIRDSIFQLLVHGKDKEFQINYDRDISKIQVKDLEIDNVYKFKEIQFITSKFENCYFENCYFYSCEFENCEFNNCQFLQGNKTNNSKIEMFTSNLNNDFSGCFIQSSDSIETGHFKKCIFYKTEVSSLSYKEKCKNITVNTGNNKIENKYTVQQFIDTNILNKPKLEFIDDEWKKEKDGISKKFSKKEKEILKRIFD